VTVITNRESLISNRFYLVASRESRAADPEGDPANRRPETRPRRLIDAVPMFLRPAALPAFCALASVVCFAGTLQAAPQAQGKDLPVSLDRIRQDLAKTPPTVKFDMPVKVPVATFKSRVDQRVYVLTLREWLDKEFKLTPLQRQSADWAANCCGISLDPVFDKLEQALHRRKLRKIREQVASELAAVEAARKKAAPEDKQ
jgi:hypothetical protein